MLITVVFSLTASAQLKSGSIKLTPDIWGYKPHLNNATGDCVCNWQDVLNNNNAATGLYAIMYRSPTFLTDLSFYGFDGLATYYGGIKIADFGHDILGVPGAAYMRLFSTTGDTIIQAEANDGTVRIADMSGSGFKTVFESGVLSQYVHLKSDNRSGQIALAGDGIPPSVTYGSAAGTVVTGTSIVGDDRSGIITFTTGPGATTGNLCTVVFTQVFTSPVRVVPFPASDLTAGFFYGRDIWTGSNFTNHFDINTFSASVPLPAGITMKIGYIVQK